MILHKFPLEYHEIDAENRSYESDDNYDIRTLNCEKTGCSRKARGQSVDLLIILHASHVF